MHEFGIVTDAVTQLLAEAKTKNKGRISSVHFRRGSAFCDASLRQAFTASTSGTPAEGATLQIDVVNLDHKCSCGHQQIINSDDLEGHMFICPKCGTIREIEEAHDLELIGYEAESA